MKNISSICIAIFLLFLLPSPAFSFQFLPAPKVNAEYFRCGSIFTGTVLSERVDIDKDEYINGWWYSAKVSKVFLGQEKGKR